MRYMTKEWYTKMNDEYSTPEEKNRYNERVAIEYMPMYENMLRETGKTFNNLTNAIVTGIKNENGTITIDLDSSFDTFSNTKQLILTECTFPEEYNSGDIDIVGYRWLYDEIFFENGKFEFGALLKGPDLKEISVFCKDIIYI